MQGPVPLGSTQVPLSPHLARRCAREGYSGSDPRSEDLALLLSSESQEPAPLSSGTPPFLHLLSPAVASPAWRGLLYTNPTYFLLI